MYVTFFGGILVGGAILAYALEWCIGLLDDPREPPTLRPKVPLFGHVWGLTWHGSSYVGMACTRTDAEIFNINLFGVVKMYISRSESLIAPIQRASKTLSYRYIPVVISRVWIRASKYTYDLLGSDFGVEYSYKIKEMLAPGPGLDDQNRRMGERVSVALDELTSEPQDILLFEWINHTIIQASNCGVFGAEHPFRDRKVEDNFWVWNGYIPRHMLGIDPFGTGHAAREVVIDAVKAYRAEPHPDASHLFTAREALLASAGVPADDLARQSAGLAIANIANTVPTAYWFAYEVFSRPPLVAELRAEILRSAAVSGTRDAGFRLDVTAIKTRCPLLLSAFQETQRTRHMHSTVRRVLADTTLLDGKYLLKANNFVHMAGSPIHRDAALWGPTAGHFDPHRFVDRKGLPPPSFFVAWGAAPFLCPARQFASTELLVVLALLVVRVELEPVAGKRPVEPETKRNHASTLQLPKRDVRLRAVPREEYRGEWTVDMGDSKVRVILASG